MLGRKGCKRVENKPWRGIYKRRNVTALRKLAWTSLPRGQNGTASDRRFLQYSLRENVGEKKYVKLLPIDAYNAYYGCNV
jgi:hypothetical protein